MALVNPLIPKIEKLVKRAKETGQTSVTFGAVDPNHIETDHAVNHFDALPNTKAVLKLSPYGKYWIMVSWLNETKKVSK